MTGQAAAFWRIGPFFAVCLLVSFVSQSIGLLVSAIFVNNVQTAITVAPISCLPLVLLSGFFVKIQTISSILLPFTWINYLRHSFEAMIITIYGLGRIDEGKSSTYTRSTTSSTIITHKRIHTGEKPYSCDYKGCNYRAKESSANNKTQKNSYRRKAVFL